MLKNKQQNIRGVKTSRYKQTFRKIVMTLTVMIFIFGGGLVIYNKVFKTTKVSQTIESPSSEIPGWWYQKYFKVSVCDDDICKPDADPDKDKLSNAQEFFYNTSPLNAYTVKDELSDGQLVAAGFDPSRPGRMTFDAVLSEDNILGESLAFNSDIKQLINETIDPNNVRLPEIVASDLKLANTNSIESIANYLITTQEITGKYFPKNIGNILEASVNSYSDERIEEYKSSFHKAYVELANVPVPNDFVQLHKYNLQLLKVLPIIISMPRDGELSDPNSDHASIWFAQTQAAFSLYQRIDLETKRLAEKYEKQQ